MNQGLYESLITQLIETKLSSLNKNYFQIEETPVDKEEAAIILSRHLGNTLNYAFSLIKGDVEKQIELANKIILFLKEELNNNAFEDDLIDIQGKILKAVFSKVNTHFSDLKKYLKEITPYSRLIHSELFTGGNVGISLESELRKEILSSNRIDLLVSFIKWKGIIILEKELKEFTRRGGQLRVITTTYMGASDYKAIHLLSSLANTEVKISYNTANERLHAKAYLFYRETGFHTAYIGSSNFSRSALTDGLEWNLKITTAEVGHIIQKFQKTFETYWLNSEFEVFNEQTHSDKLKKALTNAKTTTGFNNIQSFFDLKPYHFQLEILEKLQVERSIHGRFKNLIVAATGTGKTVISAFDYKNYSRNNKSSRLLFIAHRKEILLQSLRKFQGVLKDNNFGELWVDGLEPSSYEYVFASIQTLGNRLKDLNLSREYYDFIVIDEVHHIKAASYRPILDYFTPKVLVGLTATPERMDGANILEDFSNRIAAEIRLPEAMNKKLLCPFQYFGISDSVDLSNVRWEKGKYVASEISDLYTSNDLRVGEIITNIKKYTKDSSDVCALAFCITIEHAKFMASKFLLAGYKADYLSSENSKQREELKYKLQKKEINYLFVVDIFNEGVDIPQIDTVLFLRPTESLTVFLQQLGRGLRIDDSKDCLTVLDFVGNARPEYDFEGKFRALIGKTNTSIKRELETDFPHLPLGCSIVLEKKAKQIILDNITKATSPDRNQILKKINNFEHQTALPLTLRNFLEFTNIPIELIYKKDSWSRLLQIAGKINDFSNENEKQIVSAIKNKWLSTSSFSYFKFLLEVAKQGFKVDVNSYSENEIAMLTMLHYDVWQNPQEFNSLEESVRSIGKNEVLLNEIIEVLSILIDRIDFNEKEIYLPYNQPLKVHARYTRDQILVAFKMSSFEIPSHNRIGGGVAENKNINTEILFIDLIKSEENYSPTTMYDDYAVSETLFHWQSQNQTRNDLGKGLTYINHEKAAKVILLFVREQAKNEFNRTMGYVFLGSGNLQDHYGSKPMNITWKLNEPMPNYLWKQSAKMSVE